MLNKFIDLLQEQFKNGSIYVWGGQGEIASVDFIKKCESGTNEKNALKLYDQRLADGYDPAKIRCFDCSGLGIWSLQQLGIIKTDMTANGLMGKCTMIDKSAVKKGCWVFKTYKTAASAKKNGKKKGDAYHIGYVVDDSLNVVEAQGRAYGVVKRPLSKGGWNAYGIPSYFKDEIAGGFAGFTRNLKKGCKGEDVAELQKLLNNAGDHLSTDGIFGNKTRDAVRSFQKRKKLVVDGIAGKKTITALGGTWIG